MNLFGSRLISYKASSGLVRHSFSFSILGATHELTTRFTGRTGHWLNHSKEVSRHSLQCTTFDLTPDLQHCIVAVRKSLTDPTAEPKLPSWFRKGLDTQVILAEVRETSRKPDELYDMVERILGGQGRKVELFGRTHNLRKGW